MSYRKLLLVLQVAFLGCFAGYGQIIKYDFGTVSGSIVNPYNITPAVVNSNLATSSFSWTSSTGNLSGGTTAAYTPVSMTMQNSSGTPTLTLTFTVPAGFEVSISSFDFWRRRTNLGAQNWAMTIGATNLTAVAVGSGTVPLTTGTFVGDTPVTTANNMTGTVTIILTLSGASGAGSFTMDEFTLNGSVTRQNITSNGTGGGNWSSTATWAGGIVPSSGANVTIAAGDTVTMDSATFNTRNLGTTTTVNAGGTLATGAFAYNNNGATNVNGTFRLDNSGSVTGNDLVYDTIGTTSTLVIATPITITSAGPNPAWPSSNSPYNVSVTGGGLTINSSVSRTVTGTFLVASAVAQNGTLLINGICQINGGPGFSGSSPTYGGNATLVYNQGGTANVGIEWTGNSTSPTAGLGTPRNVTIQNSTTLTMPATNRSMAGNLNINSGNFTLNASADLYIAGNWTRVSTATFTHNNRTVYFSSSIANTIHTVTVSATGTETFNALTIQGSGTLKQATGTNITITGSGGLALSSTNASSTIDLNGQTLTLTGGGNLGWSGGARFITSTIAGGVFTTTTSIVTISLGGAGTLSTDTNTIVNLKNGFNLNNYVLTINGTLQIDSGGFINTNSPIYGNASTLIYQSGGTYRRGFEWFANGVGTIGTTAGYPNNVQLKNNTAFDYNNGNPANKAINGNLTIASGSTFNMTDITMGAPSAGVLTIGGSVTNSGIFTFAAVGTPVVIAGDLTNSGTVSLGSASGADLKLAGNFINTGTFNGNNRAIFFTKTGTQTISSSTALDIPKLLTTGGGTTVSLLSNLTISCSLGGIGIDFGNAADIIDLSGNSLIIGTPGLTNTINGLGTFKGSTTSNLTLLGIGSIGTISFTSGFQNLGTFTMNRQTTTIGCVLGSLLTVNNSLVLTNGLIDLGANNLTLGATAIASGASSNSYVLAFGTSGGQLIKTFSGAGSFTYPIGDNTSGLDYSPATLTFTGGTYGGTVGTRVVDAAHPQIGSVTSYLTRYWQVYASGVMPSNYTFDGTYASSGDLVGAAAIPTRWNGAGWVDDGNIALTGLSPYNFSVTGTTFPSATNEFTAKTGTPPPYYRSAVAGSWATASNWQSSTDNSNWITSVYVPDSAATAITIRDLYNITISSGSVTADDINIDSGATLTVSGGTFTLNNGAAATDLQINGTLTYSGGTLTQTASAGIAFGAGATYNHAIASATLTLPIANWNITSNCNVYGFNASTPKSGATGSNLGQTFGNFTWNNAGQSGTGYMNIENSSFVVTGTLTVGPSVNNLLSFGNTGTYNYTINRIVVTGGLLNCAGGANVTLAVTNDVSVSGGIFNVSKGAGTAVMSIGTDLLISDVGSFNVISSATSPSTTLTITRDLLITGTDVTLNLEATGSTNGVGTINVGRNFSCTSSGTTYAAVDFGGSTTSSAVAGNVVTIKGNFTKSGNCFFQTYSYNSATGFSFNGTGIQSFSYTGAISSYTSYTVQSGSTLQMNSNLTLGTETLPVSSFTVSGTLDFGTNSIIAGNTTDPRFLANTSSILITTNTGGMGGTTPTGSLQNFGSVGSTAANGTAAFAVQAKYTFNANTTTPFPNGAFGSPIDTVTVNATVTSNIASANLIINGVTAGLGALNVNNGGTFILNPTSNNLFLNNNSSLNIASGGTFDNNGENQITTSGGTPSINITGRFITRDAQGFVGASTAIPSITPVLNAGSTVEYGLSGNQAVQGSTAPTYQNVTFSANGTKTLASANAVVGTITVSGSAIFNAGNNLFGSPTSGITMTGTSKYQLFGTSASKPESGGTYSLGINTTFEFTGASNTDIRVSSPTINYANIIISGIARNPATVTGILFQAGGTFRVNIGATFKLANNAGFNGATNTAINSTNNPSIILDAGSTVEYYGASQTLTPITYSKLTISGTGTKSIASSSEILVGDELNVIAATLQIDSGKLLTVTNAIKNTSGNDILVLNGGNLVQIFDVDNATTNANTGNIRMTRTTRALNINDYIYWGSPVKENVFSQIPSSVFEVSYDWNLSGTISGTWNYLSTTAPGKGFITRLGAATSGTNFNFTGTANNGIVKTFGNSYDNGATITASGNTILLANPYPCAIDASIFLSDIANSGKLGGTLYFWTSFTPITNNTYNFADYATWNGTGGTAAATDPAGTSSILKPTGKIAAGQGFFARLLADYNVTFNNTMRLRTTADNAQFFKTTQSNTNLTSNSGSRIWLNLTNQNNAFRQMLVGYVDGATNGYDNLYDGHSITYNQVDIYSINSDKNLVIQGRALPFSYADTVPIGYRVTEPGNYSITIDEVDGLFLGNQDIYLEDTLLNVIHDLKQSAYTFATAIGNFDNRFILRYTTNSLGNPNFGDIQNSVIVSTNYGELTIKSSIENIQDVTVYDILGRQLFFAKAIKNKNFSTYTISASQQTLIVRINLENGVLISRKIVL